METELNSGSGESSTQVQASLDPTLVLSPAQTGETGRILLKASFVDANNSSATNLDHESTGVDPPRPPPCGLPSFYMVRGLPNSRDPQTLNNSKAKAKISKKIAFIQRESTKEKAKEVQLKPDKLKKKQSLSRFLKGVAGDDLDTPACPSDPCIGMGLRDVAKKRITARKEILPLTSKQLSGFRLLAGALTSGSGSATAEENLELESSLSEPPPA